MTCPHAFGPSRYAYYDQCHRCGTLRHTEPLDPVTLYKDEYWSDKHERSSLKDQVYNLNVHQENGVTKNQYLLDRLPEYSVKFLEIGCAPGSTAHELLFNHRVGSLIGIEYDSRYADEIREIAGEPIPLIFGAFPACTSAMKDGSFDTILAADVLEHCPDPIAFVQECARLLPKGGELLLMLPLVENDGKIECERMLHPEHIWLLSKSYIAQLLQDSGFTDLKFDAWTSGHESIAAVRI